MSEPVIRLTVFAGVFALLAMAEMLFPAREVRRLSRWPNALAMMVLYTGMTRLLAPFAAVGVAVFAAERGLGLFNLLALPEPAAIAISVVILDLAVWAQHVAMHHVPWLWRLHRVHHSDIGFDVTTGVRFHPLEVLLSLFWKAAVVLLLGAPAVAVLIFEILLSSSSLYTHANVSLPRRLDRPLRWLIVTPDMHRIHHSTDRAESDRNFGFNLSLWDRLSGLILADARPGFVIGQEAFREPGADRLDRLLTQPWRDR